MEHTFNKEKISVFYSSDFHSDFWKKSIAPFTSRVEIHKYDLFILAGDIGEWNDGFNRCREIYEAILGQGKTIVMVPGNHEFYSGNYQLVLEELGQYAENNPLFYFLDRNFLDLPEFKIRIWGDTFWTDFRGDDRARSIARRVMNDYRKIYFQRSTGGVFLEPEDTVVLNDRARCALRGAYQTLPEGWEFLAVTHHAPFPESTPKQYRKPDYTDVAKINKAYANDLYEWCSTFGVYPNAWIHGHIHDRAHYEVEWDGRICTVISNPFGYPGEKDHDQVTRHSLIFSSSGILVV